MATIKELERELRSTVDALDGMVAIVEVLFAKIGAGEPLAKEDIETVARELPRVKAQVADVRSKLR